MQIEWGPFLLALLVIIVVPGPDFVLVSRNAANGARWGWIAAGGVTCGLIVHAAAATFGLSALMLTIPAALIVVKAIGAGYLVFLGVQMVRNAGSRNMEQVSAEPNSRHSVFLRGVLIDLLNPKVMLTFLTLLPQAMDPAGPPLKQAALLSGVAVCLFASWWLFVVPLARRLSTWLANPKRMRVFERCCGSALLAMATSVAFA